MQEIGKVIFNIDRNVHDDEFLDFEVVEYNLKIKSSIYFGLDEDKIASNEYIVTYLINHVKDLLTNENIAFAIRDTVIEQRQIG